MDSVGLGDLGIEGTELPAASGCRLLCHSLRKTRIQFRQLWHGVKGGDGLSHQISN